MVSMGTLKHKVTVNGKKADLPSDTEKQAQWLDYYKTTTAEVRVTLNTKEIEIVRLQNELNECMASWRREMQINEAKSRRIERLEGSLALAKNGKLLLEIKRVLKKL